MKSFKLIVSTPNGNVFEEQINELSVRGSEGSLAVRANHVPFITAIKAGELKIYDSNDDEAFYQISDGLLTVAKQSTTILCGYMNKINQEN